MLAKIQALTREATSQVVDIGEKQIRPDQDRVLLGYANSHTCYVFWSLDVMILARLAG